jgi:DNA-binding SARP family transcriptional activator
MATRALWDDLDAGTSAGSARLLELVFERFPHGLMVVDRSGALVACNDALRRLLQIRPAAPGRALSCCSLLGCGDRSTSLAEGCIARAALERTREHEGVRVRLPSSAQLVSVTATALDELRGHVVIEIVDGGPSVTSTAPPEVWVRTLGRTTVETQSARIHGAWLEQRPGELLKFLVAARHRVVSVEEITEAIWPEAPFTSKGTVRQLVHALRDRLEPERAAGQESRYIVANRGGYALNASRVAVDADEFVTRARPALGAFVDGEPAAAARLEDALGLYRGDFLADEPYAVWAMSEREQIRDYAERLLRALSDLAVERGDLRTATMYLERLSELEPFDSDVHRRLIGLALASGRRSRAARLFRSFELRLLRTFGEPPDFELADLAHSGTTPLADGDDVSWLQARTVA